MTHTHKPRVPDWFILKRGANQISLTVQIWEVPADPFNVQPDADQKTTPPSNNQKYKPKTTGLQAGW